MRKKRHKWGIPNFFLDSVNSASKVFRNSGVLKKSTNVSIPSLYGRRSKII